MNAAASGVNMNAAAAAASVGVSRPQIENQPPRRKCRICNEIGHNSYTCQKEDLSNLDGHLHR